MREHGPTSYQQGSGKCARCNQTKEAPGWTTQVVTTPATDRGRPARRTVRVTTPLGHHYDSRPPPLLGWGSQSHPLPGSVTVGPASERRPGRASAPPAGREAPAALSALHRRKRPRRPERTTPRQPAQRRPRVTSHLERQLCRYLT